MALSLKKEKEKQKKKTLLPEFPTMKQTKQQHIIATALRYKWRYYQAVALNDQQLGPTSLAPLSP